MKKYKIAVLDDYQNVALKSRLVVSLRPGRCHGISEPRQSEKEVLIVAASAVRDLPTVEIVSRELAMALPEPRHDDDDTG